MNSSWFDDLSRRLAQPTSRRDILKILAATAMEATFWAANQPVAYAAKKVTCVSNGTSCITSGGTCDSNLCCSGYCDCGTATNTQQCQCPPSSPILCHNGTCMSCPAGTTPDTKKCTCTSTRTDSISGSGTFDSGGSFSVNATSKAGQPSTGTGSVGFNNGAGVTYNVNVACLNVTDSSDAFVGGTITGANVSSLNGQTIVYKFITSQAGTCPSGAGVLIWQGVSAAACAKPSSLGQTSGPCITAPVGVTIVDA